ncbi:sulfite reductase [NADPH] flavoprotein alpha-component [Mycolicibacterium fortuitum]|uniref:Sulfite reductase [NADPH] flavoprotein alpha-component n=1 Tax=Mycolicibacterium fortuitum TaxID=1766 RepID=A0A378U9D4_MYCFO|nr:sulfite reductase [NADPH] flavoprotein alpha-component [Mycolicibacterium fortuitum]
MELDQLGRTTHFIVVTSTFGDGEFPDTATLFWEAISSSTDRLEHMSFAVLALGDTSYELFCNAGKLLDARLEELGATRLADRVDVDGYYEEPRRRGPPTSSNNSSPPTPVPPPPAPSPRPRLSSLRFTCRNATLTTLLP